MNTLRKAHSCPPANFSVNLCFRLKCILCVHMYLPNYVLPVECLGCLLDMLNAQVLTWLRLDMIGVNPFGVIMGVALCQASPWGIFGGNSAIYLPWKKWDRISFCPASPQPRAILISSSSISDSSLLSSVPPQIFLLPVLIPSALPGLCFTFRILRFPLTSRPLQSLLAPSLLILLLLMSRWTSTLLSLRASPRASAPSLPMPFQERLSIFSASLTSRERRGILATACAFSVTLYRFLPGSDRSIKSHPGSPNESYISAISPGSLHPHKSPDLLTVLVFLLALTATVCGMRLAGATECCSELGDVSFQAVLQPAPGSNHCEGYHIIGVFLPWDLRSVLLPPSSSGGSSSGPKTPVLCCWLGEKNWDVSSWKVVWTQLLIHWGTKSLLGVQQQSSLIAVGGTCTYRVFAVRTAQRTDNGLLITTRKGTQLFFLFVCFLA